MGAYFYELWDEHEYDSWEAAIDDFVQRSPERAARVPAQIDELLATIDSDQLLSRELSEMGCTFQAPEGYRLWLEAVGDRIRAANRAGADG